MSEQHQSTTCELTPSIVRSNHSVSTLDENIQDLSQNLKTLGKFSELFPKLRITRIE